MSCELHGAGAGGRARSWRQSRPWRPRQGWRFWIWKAPDGAAALLWWSPRLRSAAVAPGVDCELLAAGWNRSRAPSAQPLALRRALVPGPGLAIMPGALWPLGLSPVRPPPQQMRPHAAPVPSGAPGPMRPHHAADAMRPRARAACGMRPPAMRPCHVAPAATATPFAGPCDMRHAARPITGNMPSHIVRGAACGPMRLNAAQKPRPSLPLPVISPLIANS
jgi:hypothetical protein